MRYVIIGAAVAVSFSGPFESTLSVVSTWLSTINAEFDTVGILPAFHELSVLPDSSIIGISVISVHKKVCMFLNSLSIRES